MITQLGPHYSQATTIPLFCAAPASLANTSPRGKTAGKALLLWLIALQSFGVVSVASAQGTDPVVIGTRKYNRTEFKVNTGGFEANQRASIAVLTTRNFVVAWHEGGPTDCYGRVYSQQGLATSGIFNLHPYGSSGWQYGPSPAPLPNGGLVAAWGANSSYAHGQLFNGSQSPVGGEIIFVSQNVWPAIASHTNGDFVVTGGTADAAVYARRYNANGTAYGDLFQVGSYVSGWYHPSIAYGPDGRFTITWPSGGNIWARSYRSNEFSPFGPEFQVNTTNAWSCYSPSIQYNSSNQLLVAWSGAGTADSQGIYLRRYAADATPMSSETLVNENTAPSQSQPNLGIGKNNELIASWQDSADVYARLLDANGAPFGHEFRVNKYTSGTQNTAGAEGLHGCTLLDNTNIVVGWSGDGASGGGVYLTMLQYLLDAEIRITDQPTNQEVLIGNSVTFCVTATSEDAMNYQWQFNAANIPGATTGCFTLTNAQLASAGGYRCVITNSIVTRTSQEAILSVVQYPRSARELYAMGYTNNGTYTIDPDGPGGQAPISVDCLMSMSGGGWTRLTAAIAGTPMNTDTNVYREYLYTQNGTVRYYRTPMSRLVWSWSSGKDLYGTYYYSTGAGESSFNVTPSGEHQRHGVGGSSGGGGTYKCLVIYSTCLDPANAQVQLCQDRPGIFGGACQCGVTVYMRELAGTNTWPLLLTANPTDGGTLSGSGSYPDGLRVAISATPAAGYRFAYWTGEGIENTNSPSTTILMTQARSATAQFTRVWHLTVAAEPAGSGIVTGSGDYDSGTYAAITAEPDWTSWFLGWAGGGVADTNAEITTVFMDRDRVVTGFFAAPDLLVTTVSAPTNAIAGQLVQVAWTITNSGIASASGDWSDRIWLSPNNQIGDDIPISTNQISTLIFPDDSVTRVQNVLIPPGMVGTYWIVAEANYDHGIGETTYSNNFAISGHPVVITPTPYPNLQVSVVFAPTSVFAGQETEAQWVVTNSGPQSTESATWEDAVYLSTDTDWDTSDTFLGSVPNSTALASGLAYAGSSTVQIPPRLSPGTYYLIVRTDFRNRVNEGGLDGDNSRVSNPMQVALPGWPDLQVATVTTPSDAFSGQPITIIWSVTNAGTLPTDEPSWHDRIYLSTTPTPGASMTALATASHSAALQSGQSYTNTLEVKIPVGISGTNYYFIVEADANNEVWEWVFDDNYGASAHATEIHLTPPPDLEVTSVTAASNVCAGFDLSVNYRVANNGASDTPNYSWQDAFYLSADTNFDAQTDTYLGATSHYGQLLRTNFYDATASLRVPQSAAGLRYLIVLSDSQNSVFELDKTNNHRASAFPVSILPVADLQVASVAVPASALSGFDCSVSYTVTNAATCATIGSSWSDAVYLSAGQTLNPATDTLLGVVGHSGQLGGGSAYSSTTTFRLPIGLQGNYYVFVLTDRQGQVPEQSEGNNSGLAPIPVNLSLPSNDLAVTGLSAPTSALSGFNLTLTCVVSNHGTNAIPNTSWRDAFYLSADQNLSTNGIYLAEVTNSLSLAAGGSYTNTLTVRLADGLAGNFNLFAYADSGTQVFEQDETNNLAMHPIPISIASIPPDLVIQNCAATTGTCIAGTSVPVSWTARNLGPGQTSVDFWSDRVVLSRDSILGNADDVVLSTLAHSGSLASNQTYSTSTSVTIPGNTAAGTCTLFVQTDSAGQVYEGGADTNNHCLAGAIMVIRPDVDLLVNNVLVTNEAWSGQNLTVAWTVRNLGNSPASPNSWSDSVYLSRNPQLGTNAILLGSVARSTGVGSLGSYTVTNQFALPWDAQGDYYVIVRADSAGQVPESAEDNNDTASATPIYIFLSPTPDLLVTAINVPAQALSGQPVTLSWTVLNNGAATAQKWYDAVYLSFDQIFDPSADIYLGYVEHAGGLDTGSSYSVTNAFNIPANLYGTVYLFVVADNFGYVYERQAEANNIARSPAIQVDLPPMADLVATVVNSPVNPAFVSQSNTVTYTVLNQSSVAANGRWEDDIYFSPNPAWDVTAALHGRVTMDLNLGPWQSYTGAVTAPIPGVVPGNYHAILRADIRNQLPEADEENNLGISTNTFPITMPTLTLGLGATNYFTTNRQSQFFLVQTPSGGYLRLTLHDLDRLGVNEIYLRRGGVPTRANYDFRFRVNAWADQTIFAPDVVAGDWYVLAYNAAGPVPGGYTLQADYFQGIGLESIYPTALGNQGPGTVAIEGAGFDNTAQVWLMNGGTSYPATNVSFVSGSRLVADFDLMALPTGDYQLTVTQGTNSAALPFTVTLGGPKLETRLVVPSRVGYHTLATLYVEFYNSGNAAMPAPLLEVGATQNGRAGAWLTLNERRLVEGFWTSATPDGFAHSVQFLASGATPGLLQPGESGRVPVYYAGWQQPWDMSYPPIYFNIGVLDAGNTKFVDWAALKDSMRPSSLTTNQWEPVFWNLVLQTGPTWGDYIRMLDDNARYLYRLGENVTDIRDLLGFEVMQASGLSVTRTLASAVDAQVQAPGLPLTFTRSFSTDIPSHFTLGRLGRGWSDNWERSIQVAADGTVTILGPAGSRRIFQPDSRYAGRYFPPAGDSAVLTAIGGGAFTLQGSDGTIYAFRSDGKLDYVAETHNNRVACTYSGNVLTRLTHSAGPYLDLAYSGSRLTSVTDSLGRQTVFTYDGSGEHLQTARDYRNQTTTYQYDLSLLTSAATAHALTKIFNADGTESHYAYDSFGRLTKKAGCCGSPECTTFSYDSAGRITATDALTNSTKYYFDHRGLLVRTENPLGGIVHRTFDTDGRLLRVTDAAGRSRTFTYDPAGNPSSETDALGYSTRYTYTADFNRLASVLDAKGNLTRYAYEPDGDLASITYPDGSHEDWTRDSQGNRVSWTNRRRQTIWYTNDVLGRVIARRYPDGVLHTFNYDTQGNLAGYTDPLGATTQEFDAAGRLVKIAYPGNRWLGYTYDPAGRRACMTNELGYATYYHYDVRSRLERLTDERASNIVVYAYDAAGRMALKTLGNGVYTTYTYDSAGQLLDLFNRKPDGSALSRFQYTYDSRGRRDTMSTTYGASDPRTSLAGLWRYDYDDTGQLIGWTAPWGRRVDYTYDALGNRLNVRDNGTNTAYTVNNLNQYLLVGNTTYQYDADGNLTNKVSPTGGSAFDWTADNKLRTLAATGIIRQNYYDAMRRRTRTVLNSTSTDYVLDATGFDDVAGSYAADNSLASRYVHGLGLISRIAPNDQPGYYTFDNIGSTSELLGGLGVSNAYAYVPFGELLYLSRAIDSPYEFVGEFGVSSVQNGPTHMYAREYDVSLGRFLSTDPLRRESGDVNLVRYVGNDPLNYIDPVGLNAEELNRCLRNCQRTCFPLWLACLLGGTGTGELGCEGYKHCMLECIEKCTPEPVPGPGPHPTPPRPHPECATDGGPCMTDPDGKACWCCNHPGDPDCGGQPVPPTPPIDPNALTGPRGFGTRNYVPANALLSYMVEFENATNALVPAQQVVVSDRLTNLLDWTTFELTELAFGDHFIAVPPKSQHYETTLQLSAGSYQFQVQIEAGIRLDTGEVYARFQSLNPTNGLPPPVDIGFLPPENGTGRGQGHLSYVIRARTNLVTGTEIRSIAEITFDVNPPLSTDLRDVHNPGLGTDHTKQALVTIDGEAPYTQIITPSGPVTNANFAVCWAGSDMGSGIAGYDIYVSTNVFTIGGAWTLWLTNTPDTCAVYSGRFGQTYAFYSVAHDNVGNLESAPTFPDATIIVSNTPPVIEPVTNQFVVVGSQIVITNVASDPDGVTFSLGAGAPAGASITTNGVFSWTPACDQGSTTNLIIVRVTDHGTPPASNSVAFLVSVPECIEASLGSAVLQVGTTSSVPVRLLSTTALTNMSLTVVYPAERFTSFTLTVNSLQVLTQRLSFPQPGQAQVSFTLPAASVLHGPTNVGQLGFTALSNQHSAIVPLAVSNVAGLKLDGGSAAKAFGQPGRVVVIGPEPLLEFVRDTNGLPLLILYGKPGSSYTMEWRTNLMAGTWQFGWRVPLTNLFQDFGVEANKPSQFYRAYEFFADPPILELGRPAATNPSLLLYGVPGTNYIFQATTNLSMDPDWFPWAGLTLTNSFKFTEISNSASGMMFFRALRP